MSEKDRETKQVGEWASIGKPLAIRTRGGSRTRGAVMSELEIKKGTDKISELLQQLNEAVPTAPWVVVIDGKINSLVEEVCQKAKGTRESSKFWLIDQQPEKSKKSLLNILGTIQLNPEDAEDIEFLKNLVPDLVIVPSEPKDNLRQRIERWVDRARYIQLDKELEESLAKDIKASSNADMIIIDSRDK